MVAERKVSWKGGEWCYRDSDREGGQMIWDTKGRGVNLGP